MGGRGGAVGLSSTSRTTPEQNRIMGNMERVLERDSAYGYSKPTFKTNKDGSYFLRVHKSKNDRVCSWWENAVPGKERYI